MFTLFFFIESFRCMETKLARARLQDQILTLMNGTEFDGFPANSARNEIDFSTFKYGCHCRFDKSMQQMGRGEPVDAIDTACKVYKVIKLCLILIEKRSVLFEMYSKLFWK